MRSMLLKECCEDAMRKLNIALLLSVLLAGGLRDRAFAQIGNFQLEPSGAQLELLPGHSTVRPQEVRR